MKFHVPKVKPIGIFFFFISFSSVFFLTEQMLLKYEGELWAVYVLWDLGCTFCLRWIWNRKKDVLFETLLVLIVVTEMFRYATYKDTNELIEVLSLSLFIFLLNNIENKYQKVFITASGLSMIAEVGRASLYALLDGDFSGNRVGIMTALFLTILICLFEDKMLLKYIIIAFGIVILMLLQSRTCVLAFVGSALVHLFIDLKGKLTTKKMILIALLALSVVWFATLGIGQFLNLFYNKWGSASMSSLDVRIIFWTDIFSHSTYIGLAPDYMLNRYGVANCHNTFIQAYLQFGWIVFSLHCAWFIRLLYKGIKEGFKQKNTWFSYIAFYTIMSITECVFMYDSAYTLIPICLTAVTGIMHGNMTPANVKNMRGGGSAI